MNLVMTCDTPPEEKEQSNQDQLPLLPSPVCQWRSATSRWPVELR